MTCIEDKAIKLMEKVTEISVYKLCGIYILFFSIIMRLVI